MTRQVPLGGAESLTAVGGAESLATFGGVESVATMGGADSLTKVGGADAAVAVVGAAEGSVGAAESPASDPQPRESSSRSRSRKVKPGRITFVGSGPGDPGLLTTRAQAVLAHAELVFTDPDVPEAVLALVGTDLPPAAGPAPAKKNDKADKATDKSDKSDKADKADDAKSDDPAVIPGGPEVRPALGDPAEVAKTLASEARHGYNVVRLIAGDPLSVDAVITEINALAKTHLTFEIVPGLPDTTAVPTYAGLPLGSSHTVADVRGDVDWAALAAAPGPLILHATASHLPDAARTLIEHGLVENTPAVVTANGTTCQQRSVETTLVGLTDKTVVEKPAGSELLGPLTGPLVVTIGKTVANRAKLNWWESRALYGWTVLVPRTKDQAGEMSERLVTHGALPIEVPTIAVEPPRSPAQMERAVKGLVDGRFQWVVFTSTNAVRAVWEKFNEFGLDARAFSGVKIACVGQATADKVRAFGINPELVPSGEQSSLGLLDEFPPYDEVFDPVNRVLLPRADIATETLAEGLRERGWEIEDVTAYRTVRAAPPPAHTREMIKTGGFDAVCFTSSSTVRNLVGIAGKPHARTIVACIGPKTAETAIEFGLRVDVQPETAAVGPLVEALAEHAARLRAEGALPPPRKKSRRR
ncbi:bifunctional uroporphyrinogen-III C-methyltransferase/uroporphyrinogen-III synthase [Mycolicibacterium smegmatis]|uniref:Uroporphyrin-III C-methyltransferase/uroporphyrinogen-III synthase n=3 Tax=Mycolicibacterium smegmatis TaxID=1772 RepID=I7G4G9_MYCS2|nr:uroporphyrinogen-III synthase [Mycolicibacterium smegmatis]AFP37409.1 Uroporphyrin-III C-methyltransferase/uroporphyrinogen-III synthase [Mycolicibacterium smegmatis MC2 155]MCC3334638.1 bifunctional uroporphyrinogen-III C-methyltransferase/uroporphyrinogen-III synthase [Mycolicibacterium smegmatis]MCO4196758.1 bifunctional uroporphyrinogen-III C-methyltransferase/uroporphyrinogen-III synthase [Mycolicibacterium smegmatis]UUR97296.1 bifunctional uroporphyrinogen-III C-methyltransferase/uropo